MPAEARGSELLEIFSLKLIHNWPQNVCGSIQFRSPNLSHTIFHRDPAAAVPLKPNTPTSLFVSPPPQPISTASAPIAFSVDLRIPAEHADGGPAEVFCEGLLCYDDPEIVRDRLVTARLNPGSSGRVDLAFAFYSCAVAAHVTVSLVNLRGRGGEDVEFEAIGRVFGRVCAGSSWIAGACREIFREEEGGGVGVGEGDWRARVCRSVVAAPVGSMMFVGMDLWGYCESRKGVRRIADGRAEFQVRNWGTSREVIAGEGCDIEVEVVWCA